MNISTLLNNTKKELTVLDAEVLLAHVLQQPRSYLRAHGEQVITDAQQQQFQQLMQRRLRGEPVAYLTGTQEFWSLNFSVTPDVLIPRPETELLVETVLKLLPADEALRIADLGTGSGAIAIALASERPAWHIVAIDQSAAALRIAQQNAQRYALKNIHFLPSDWCTQLPEKNYAAIVANPPYIAADDPHLKNLSYEPQTALIAADQGLAAIKIIAAQAKHYLRRNGILFFEHGYQQAATVQELLQRQGYQDINTLNDLAGLARVSYASLIGQ